MQLNGLAGLGMPVVRQQAPAATTGSASFMPSLSGAAQTTPAADAVLGTGKDAGGDSARLAEERATANVMNDRFAQQCQTCKSRRYQDGSDDPGVSFQTPTNIAPGLSASAVRGHEQEHVMREQAKANREGGKVLSQSVVLHGDVCPECGRYYISGGTTTTVTRSGGEDNGRENSHGHGEEASGQRLDATA